MIAYHCDSNTILQAPFVNRKDKHRIRAYNSIMQKLADRGHHVDIQILDNEVSAGFRLSGYHLSVIGKCSYGIITKEPCQYLIYIHAIFVYIMVHYL